MLCNFIINYKKRRSMFYHNNSTARKLLLSLHYSFLQNFSNLLFHKQAYLKIQCCLHVIIWSASPISRIKLKLIKNFKGSDFQSSLIPCQHVQFKYYFYSTLLILPKIFIFLHKGYRKWRTVYTYILFSLKKLINMYLFVILYTHNWHTFNK